MTANARDRVLTMEERKRLGQFFTGTRLARALAALSKAQSASSILDPMAGSGDMLVACGEIGASPSVVGAIELDPAAAYLCQSRTGELGVEVHLEIGSAFRPESWRSLAGLWDLVITNPPYVRYQRGSFAMVGRIEVPTADAVREGLLAILDTNDSLTEMERDVFVSAARTYSGLSDLAVPSWLLAASKVTPGGRLAIVVPDTWLSRNYAAPVLCVLRRFFEIERVILDGDAAWFDDALVRTTLVVARRVPDKMSALEPGRHLVVSVPSAAGTQHSIVGAAFLSEDPEGAFAEWATSDLHPATAPLVSEWSDELELVAAVQRASERHPWMTSGVASIEPAPLPRRVIPRRIRKIVGSSEGMPLTDLEGLGWVVGQGLRTGANDFFYVEAGVDDTFRSTLLPGVDLILPTEVVRLAVRRQADLLDVRGTVTRPRTGVLVLDGWAMPEDIEKTATKIHRPISGDLARLIRAAASATYQRGKTQIALPELSAVRTNVRPGRFWYHLPRLTSRHAPDLFIARVNGRNPRPYQNGAGARAIRDRRELLHTLDRSVH